MKTTTKLWIGIALLMLLSPLGLLLPEYFKAGDAWGEWEIFSSLWKPPLPDYAFKGGQEKGLGFLSLEYMASAIIGILITVCAVFLIGKLLTRKK